jgi:hypothetical protein
VVGGWLYCRKRIEREGDGMYVNRYSSREGGKLEMEWYEENRSEAGR